MALRVFGRALPPFGRTTSAPDPPNLARLVWSHFRAQPGFDAEQREAMKDLASGRAVPLREIPRER
jgi:hypothetical protein